MAGDKLSWWKVKVEQSGSPTREVEVEARFGWEAIKFAFDDGVAVNSTGKIKVEAHVFSKESC